MIPGANVRTVGSLVQGVIEALQERTDIISICPRYIRKAIIELTESYPFEELRRTGSTVSLTTNQSVYPVSTFLNNGDDYSWPEVFTIFIDYPTNSVKGNIDYKTPKSIETITSAVTVGIPAYFTRFGPNFKIAPTPFNPFSVYLQYQVKHPFPDDVTDTVALNGQQLFLPNSWEEIVEYAAAERIAIVKRWNDQADQIHKILYGDPAAGMDGVRMARPGLIAARLFQVERDQQFNTRQLGIRVGRYSSR